jgi:DNA (cytosine-5)-methyltransferase 1
MKSKPVANGRFRVVDLCCGLGGLSLSAKQIGMTVVAGVDTNAHALKTFSKNFPDAEALEGSIRSGKLLARCADLLKLGNDASAASVVVSGPPCQGFSVAGPRDPNDSRNQVLVAAARAIAKLQPDCALIENVSMVLAPEHDSRLNKLQRVLVDAGYYVTRVLLDASEFGTPQRRRRAFFLITRKKLDQQKVLNRLEAYKSPAKGTKEVFRGLPKPLVRPDDYDDEAEYGIIANHFAMQHSRRVMNKIAKIEPGTGPMSYRRLHPTRPSNTLISGHRAPPAHFKEPRSITVREAARLQGLPDGFRVFGSFANQMGQVTNAVPPPLARAVLQTLVELAEVTAH